MKNRRLSIEGVAYGSNWQAKLRGHVWLVNADRSAFSAAASELVAQLSEQVDLRPKPMQELSIVVERTCMPSVKLRITFDPTRSRVQNTLTVVTHLKNLADQLFPEPTKKAPNEK